MARYIYKRNAKEEVKNTIYNVNLYVFAGYVFTNVERRERERKRKQKGERISKVQRERERRIAS